MELKSIADDFLNKFSYRIEENNRSEKFRGIIQFLVRFEDDDRHRSFEIRRPIT